MPLGLAVLGAGRMGRTHALSYRGIRDAQVRIVCDLDGDRAKTLASEVGAEWTSSYSDALRRKDVDAVSICLPDQCHREPAIAAARGGKHILLEKPIATTVEDGVAILEAAAAAGVTFMVAHNLRFDPRYCLAQESIRNGRIGAIQTAYVRRMGRRSRHLGLAGRVSLPLFLGVHDFDVLRWFVGSEVERVTALGRRGYFAAQGFDVDDAVSALLLFSNGVVATVDLGWHLPERILGFQFRADVIGDKGWVSICYEDQGLTISTDTEILRPDTSTEPVIYGAVAGTFHNEIEHFVRCVLEGREPVVSARDALEAVRIAVAVEQSARLRETVRLSGL